MRKFLSWAIAASALLAFVSVAMSEAGNGKKLRVLIVDGQNNHTCLRLAGELARRGPSAASKVAG